MTVDQILGGKGTAVISIGSNASISEVAAVLAERRFGALPVLDDGRLVGMLSERDIIRGIAIRGEKVLGEAVSTLMTTTVHCCSRQDTVDDILALMTERKIRHVPVMDGDSVIGLISIGDVVKEKITETEREAAALKSYIASA